MSPDPFVYPSGGNHTLLLIEDDEGIRRVTCLLLKIAGYRTIEASNGVAGVAAYRENKSRILAVLTDLIMPRMAGDEVVRQLRAIDPDVRIVVMSGALTQSNRIVEEPGRLKYVSKPTTPSTLREAIRSVTAALA